MVFQMCIRDSSNPSDVEVAIELGLDVVKFFPAEAAGGLNMIDVYKRQLLILPDDCILRLF